MTTWGLVVEMTIGTGERKHTESYVLAHSEGTRQEALAELEARARKFAPEHPRSPKRRRLFRSGDGFLLVIDGAWSSFSTRFTLAELLEDSAAPPAPPPAPAPVPLPPSAPEPAPVPEPGPEPDVERYCDGVPVKPSWLRRSGL